MLAQWGNDKKCMKNAPSVTSQLNKIQAIFLKYLWSAAGGALIVEQIVKNTFFYVFPYQSKVSMCICEERTKSKCCQKGQKAFVVVATQRCPPCKVGSTPSEQTHMSLLLSFIFCLFSLFCSFSLSYLFSLFSYPKSPLL